MSGLPTERRLTTPEAEIASMRSRIQALEDRASRMAWYGAPHGGSYPPHSVVRDGPWTMVSLRSTDEPPAPPPTRGPPPPQQGTRSTSTRGRAQPLAPPPRRSPTATSTPSARQDM